MRFRWPEDTVFARRVLEVEDRACPCCGRHMHVCDHRLHRIFTLDGPLCLVCKLVHCPDRACSAHTKTFSPHAETGITLPWWLIGWDVFCWLGHRRFARHWSIPQIQAELADSYHIPLSHDAIGLYVQRYQNMLAARQQDPQMMVQEYRGVDALVLSIDGLQPEKGHETLYVVRELTRKRVWFAEPLISSTAAEVRRLLAQARAWADRLGIAVQLWLSDKQDAFVTGIAAEFPGVAHRYCANHFLRDLAKPMLEADSSAKVKMRSKVRGLRAIEREVLQSQVPAARAETMAGPDLAPVPTAAEMPATPTAVSAAEVLATPTAVVPAAAEMPATPAAVVPAAAEVLATPAAVVPAAAEVLATPTAGSAVVLDYCTVVRGILNDDQGGPLRPPGLRMADALREVRDSLHRNVGAKKGGALRTNWNASAAASTVALTRSKKRRRKSVSTSRS